MTKKKAEPKTDERLEIRYIPVNDGVLWDTNPKAHDLEALKESIWLYGFVDPPKYDGTLEAFVYGNGRTTALREGMLEGYQDGAVPRGIVIDGETGDWLMPVKFGVDQASIATAEALAIDHNNLTVSAGDFGPIEIASMWEAADYVAMLQHLDSRSRLPITVDEAALDLLVDLLGDGGDEEDIDAPAQPDRADELRKKWGVEFGQCWALGEHRLLCGDATDAAMVERLLDIDCNICVTDPPYGVEYDPEWRQEAAEAGHLAYAARRVGEVENDDRVDWSDAWALFRGNVFYCWHAGRHAAEVQASIEGQGYVIRSQIVWVKSNFPISRGHYHWRHEPCWYAVRKGGTASWIGDRSQTTVWEINLDTNVAGGHSTQKPLECMARAIRHHEGNVYDPFIGSGTTLMACVNEGRICRGMDISPGYVAVTLERYLEATGEKPELLDR